MLERPKGGGLTGSWGEIDDIVREVWGKITQKYAEREEPDWEIFWAI